MSHAAANPRFEDNGEGCCFHCGEPETAHGARCKTWGDLSWSEWHRRAREKASSEFGLRRVPRDMFREQVAAR